MVPPAGSKKPHIVAMLWDDYGWADAGWHRNYTAPGGEHVPYTDEVQTPNMNGLVEDGIELDRAYVYKYCSPSRSSFMTGRLPYHVQQVNRQNCDLGQGVADLNFTFISAKLSTVGYQTIHSGKWHLGMASRGHIPKGRGFDRSLVYFEGAEDHLTQRSCQA